MTLFREHERCPACRFFAPDEDGDGECRRYAPRARMLGQIEDVDANQDTRWPNVDRSDWCGEFEAAA